MTPHPNATTPLSAITIQALADLGYTVNAGLADPYTLPSPHLAAARAAEEAPTIDLRNDVHRGPVFEIDEDGNIVRIVPGVSGGSPGAPLGPSAAEAQANSTFRVTIRSGR